MRRSLLEPVAAPAWPDDVTMRTFRSEDAPPVHTLLEHGYRNGGGSVEPYAAWFPAMTSDEEFDPELWFLAESADGSLAGAALCWTSAFLKDLVVHESRRGRGLGEALLLHACETFRTRGASGLELKVHSDNPSGAMRLYERLGFELVERNSGPIHGAGLRPPSLSSRRRPSNRTGDR